MMDRMTLSKFTRRTMYVGDCVVWIGTLSTKGYGVFYQNGRPGYAHRFSWESTNGEIPKGLVIDHLCRNRCCVNPVHLRVCTNKENILAPGSRCVTKKFSDQPTCRYGHAYEYVTNYKIPQRLCRTCERRRASERYYANNNKRNAPTT